MIQFDADLLKKKQIIENHLDRLFPKENLPYHRLLEAARYALLGGGGKRMRPILALITCETFGGNTADVIEPACAVELIHTYSLIHDDLPCMDNDDYRRGRLTVHRQFSEEIAILAGDYLLTYAFEVISHCHLNDSTKLALIKILSKRSGAEGMVGGQVIDLTSEGKSITLKELERLHQQKTAALLSASIEIGGIVAGVEQNTLETLKTIGFHLGQAFQIVDDIIDVTNSEIKHGKKTSSDQLKEKSTYVSLLGLDQAKHLARDHYQKSLRSLRTLNYDTTQLERLAAFILYRSF